MQHSGCRAAVHALHAWHAQCARSNLMLQKCGRVMHLLPTNRPARLPSLPLSDGCHTMLSPQKEGS